MHSWEREFTEHPLWAKVGALKTKAETIDKPGEADDVLAYVVAVADMIEVRHESTPAILVTPGMLQNVSNQIDNLSTTLDNWVSGSYTGQHVVDATRTVVDALAAWPPLTPNATAKAFATNARKIVEAADEAIETMEIQRANLEGQVADLRTDTNAIQDDIAAQRAALDAVISEFKEAGAEATKETVADWDKVLGDQETVANGHVEQLRTLEAEARNLVHAATSSIVATEYGAYARNKAVAAWTCDIAAGILGSAGVVVLLLHLFRAGAGADGSIGLSLTRLAASLGVLGVAALVAKRGTEHHKESRAAKRTDLALRKIGPFTENLPADVRERVLVDLTERIFIRGELADDPGAAEKSSIMAQILEARQAAAGGDAAAP